MKKIILFLILITIFLFSCSEDKKEIIISKTLPEYKQIWKDTFLNYQNSKTQLKKSGIFDFEITIMVNGDEKSLINKFSNLNLTEPFNSLSLNFDGDYDFNNKDNLILNGNLKIFFNKRNFGLGDLDINFSLKDNNKLTYTLNNLDQKLLKLLLSDKNKIDQLVLFFNDNKAKENIYNIPEGVLISFFEETGKNSLEDSLYKNSKEEEKMIIDAFLNNEVIEVLSGETKDNIDKLNFKLNTDNLIKFFNEVAIIIGGDNEQKNFDQDKELFKNINLGGNLDISNNLIVNSYIKTQIILSGLNSVGEQKEDILIFDTILKLPDIKNFNLDFTTLISSNSTPNNKLQIKLKGLIK